MKLESLVSLGIAFTVLGPTASLRADSSSSGLSLDNIRTWTGAGTNRAALVIEWSTPEVLTNTAVPPPVADKTLVWGYRFNGAATAEDMLNAILAADHRLYVVGTLQWGPIYVMGLGYDLNGNGVFGVTDGQHTYAADAFIGGKLLDPNLAVDGSAPLDTGDLYWAGFNGPNWELWQEQGETGGFSAEPLRGANAYWTPDPVMSWTGAHGQWDMAESGLSGIALTNGSWVGWSVAAGGADYSDASSACTIAYNLHKHAPPTPDGTTAAYVCDASDFATQVISSSGVYTTSPYNDPSAVLGRPALRFTNTWLGDYSVHRVKLVEPPYNIGPAGDKLITEISSGGQITVKLGRKVYDDPHNPYGIDFIVYGNSFFTGGAVNGDSANLNSLSISGATPYGHPSIVSVSQDGQNWYHYGVQNALYPDNAYRWDPANASWTDEQLNPTKPVNPAVAATSFSGLSDANALNEFAGAAGGTGYDLKESGLPWIQYVRLEPGAGTYTVIDAVAAVRPAVAGDALCIGPANLSAGLTNLFFQDPANPPRTQVELSFASVSDFARVTTGEWDSVASLAPIIGQVLKGYNIALTPLNGTTPVTFSALVGLQVGTNYASDGRDLELFAWNGAGWDQPAFTYDAASGLVWVAQTGQWSTFVLGQLPPVSLTLQRLAGVVQIGFVSIPNWKHTVERSADLVNWSPVGTITPSTSAAQTIVDSAPPANKAFYRLRLNRP